MIGSIFRGLVLLLGLALGAAVALGLYGRMAHLRAVAPLPDWTRAIADDAGLAAGRAELTAGFTASWRLSGMDLRGPYWQGALSRQDARLPFTARLRWRDEGGAQLWLRFEGGSASLSGPLLTGHFPNVVGTGFLGTGGLWLDLDAAGQRLVIAGEGREDGPVNLNLGPRGWRLALGGSAPWQDTGEDPAAPLESGP